MFLSESFGEMKLHRSEETVGPPSTPLSSLIPHPRLPSPVKSIGASASSMLGILLYNPERLTKIDQTRRVSNIIK